MFGHGELSSMQQTINERAFRRVRYADHDCKLGAAYAGADLRIGPNYPLEWGIPSAAKLFAMIYQAHNLVFGSKQTTAWVLQGTFEALPIQGCDWGNASHG
jgi:hypothetical protein